MPENLKPAANKKTPDRVIVYVDGYNLYRAVNKWAKKEKNSDMVKYHLENLVLHCLKKKSNGTKSEKLKKINFYTARPLKGALSIKHYEEWTGRQKEFDIVEVIEGVHVPRSNSKEAQEDIDIAMDMFSNAFKNDNRDKKKDGRDKASLMALGIKIIKDIYRRKYKEKQTDVNIAVDMLSGAFDKKDGYDKAVLISDDTDFWRLILKCLRAGKHVLVLGTRDTHPIKKKLNDKKKKREPYSSESSELKQYMNDGILDFYPIKQDDIKEDRLDWKYIVRTSENKSNNKKQR